MIEADIKNLIQVEQNTKNYKEDVQERKYKFSQNYT